MAQVSVTLSSDLARHLDARAAAGGFSNSAAYLHALAEQDRKAYGAEVDRVRALIDAGAASGVDARPPEQILKEVIARIGRG